MKRFFVTVLCGLSLLIATEASADAVVRVLVRNMQGKPVDGAVKLKPLSDGKSFSCSTVKGACTMKSVPGGSYVVTFQPNKGSAPNPRKVMIPPDGEADLHISAK